MYTIGQLSKKTGVSIRTLHYYETLNLLNPVRSPDNQYRLYGPDDVMRLQQIAVLKRMRFRLRDISQILNANKAQLSTDDYEVWVHVLEHQIATVQKEMRELQKVEDLLQSSVYAMKATKQVRIEDMLQFIHDIEQPNQKQEFRKLYFTEDEMERLPSNNPADPLIAEWANILYEVQKHLNDAPDSQGSQQLAARIAAYGEKLFKGDKELEEKYWNFIKPETSKDVRIYGMNREVMQYIEQILDYYYSNKSE